MTDQTRMTKQAVLKPREVPHGTTMLYFNNDDKTPVVCLKVDGSDSRLRKLLRTIENWMCMRDGTSQEIMNLLVQVANQDGCQRTADVVPMRRPRIMLVNSPGMGGVGGVCLESYKKGWQTTWFSEEKYFHEPRHNCVFPGESKHGKPQVAEAEKPTGHKAYDS
jgi:hypothetical protein